jgi:peptide/nickel transport system substrate-binding protein
VRINRVTWDLEPWLAESWTRSADGLRYTIKLRPNITFSDGQRFTSDDVAFSLAAVYDDKAGSPLKQALEVSGKQLQIATPDPLTAVITFPSPFAVGLRILDNLPILPRHKLGAAFAAGTFASAWGLDTPLPEITGLGPFVLSEFVRGQRVVLTRNPRYWRKDASGAPLPVLDRITIQIVPDQDAELLRLEAGQSDMTSSEMRPSDYAPLKRDAAANRIRLIDLGDGYDMDTFWINLNPGAFADDPRASWIQKDELRHAISMAVNRELFVNTVYFGAGVQAFGPIAPANTKWYSPEVPHAPYDPARAKQLLASIGLVDRNGDGVLEDARNNPARFTLVTQKGRTDRERAAAVIRDELKKIGLVVDVVPLDFGKMMEMVMGTGKYESVYFGPGATDIDPSVSQDFWLSTGGAHFWHPGQTRPATDWERRIDDLMARQVASFDDSERTRLFTDVQKIFAEHEPAIYFAAPRVFLATSSRVGGYTPSLIPPQLLWSADTIAVVR